MFFLWAPSATAETVPRGRERTGASLEHGPAGSLPPKRTGKGPGPGVRSRGMVEETETTETPAKPQPAELAAARARDADDQVEAEADDQVEVNEGLLLDLPLPAFQRITALPVGRHVAAVENTKRSLMFVRGTALLYAAGIIPKTKATDLAGELEALAELCTEGRGGDVFSLADLMAACKKVARK